MTSDSSTSVEAAHTGVNVWIALDRVRATVGGGLAIANGSHVDAWHSKCKDSIQGKKQEGGIATCDMEELSPECHARFNNLKVLHDLEPGDGIVLARGTFHRSEFFADDAAKPILRCKLC